MTDDLISRRKAIDALMNAINDVGVLDAEDINTVFQMLPSAQLEIIRCKDCKYGILDYDFPHERYCDFKGNEWNNDDHFCGHAKRREVTE